MGFMASGQGHTSDRHLSYMCGRSVNGRPPELAGNRFLVASRDAATKDVWVLPWFVAARLVMASIDQCCCSGRGDRKQSTSTVSCGLCKAGPSVHAKELAACRAAYDWSARPQGYGALSGCNLKCSGGAGGMGGKSEAPQHNVQAPSSQSFAAHGASRAPDARGLARLDSR